MLEDGLACLSVDWEIQDTAGPLACWLPYARASVSLSGREDSILTSIFSPYNTLTQVTWKISFSLTRSRGTLFCDHSIQESEAGGL